MATRNPNLNIVPGLAAQSACPAKLQAADTELTGPRPNWWWTGKHPEQCPGFDKKAGVLRAMPMPNLASFTRQSVLDYFDNTWTLTEVLFACLQGTEAFTRQPYHQLRHPMIFYYGHPAVLYVNKFRVAGLLTDPIDQFFEQLFETGVDEMSWDDLSQAKEDWPTVRLVTEYRRKAYEAITHMILTHPALEPSLNPVGWEDQAWAVFMGFEHERIHIETSSVLIRELPLAFLRKPDMWPAYHASSTLPSGQVPAEGQDYPANGLVEVAGERVVLGKPLAYPSFGFDNEYGRKVVKVQPFRASQFKVTNGQFWQFVKAGGYNQPSYWSKEGWGWRTFRNVKWPTFWVPNGPAGLHQYKLRCLFDAIDMRWDWPVDVNYHEAMAYCAWQTERDGQLVRYRPITEAEHQLIRSSKDRSDSHLQLRGDSSGEDTGSPASSTPSSPCGPASALATDASVNVDLAMQCSGEDALAKVGANVQLAYSSHNPVNSLPASDKGFYDVFGNAWEWSMDHFAAYPGFKIHPYYDDFSAPCFGGLHHMIIGGSFISTGQLCSKYARYQFRPHFFQHATFRIVQSIVDTAEYNTERHSPSNPILPFVETSCMDGAPPHIGDDPCCSISRRDDFTPTAAEEATAEAAKLQHTQASYETDALMAQYLSLHFGPMDAAFAAFSGETGILSDALDFPKKCGEAVNRWAAKQSSATGRALDLGCAVGRSTFEMARVYGEVVGIDLSNTFIDAAKLMAEQRRIDYALPVEGEVVLPLAATIPDDIDVSRVQFMQGDACALPARLGTFDAVLAANLLCRVPNPRTCLNEISRSLAPGGLLVMTSPFTWMEQYTDKALWVGATYDDKGQPRRCGEALKALLAEMGFATLHEGMMPLVIREHGRKYQLILAHHLVAQKK